MARPQPSSRSERQYVLGWHLPDRIVDVVVVLFLVVLHIGSALILILGTRFDRGHHLLTASGTGLMVVADIALLWRRKRGVLVALVVLGLFGLTELVRASAPVFDAPLPLLVALYSYALSGRPSHVLRLSGLMWFGIFAFNVLARETSWPSILASALVASLVVGVGASLGLYVGTRRKYIGQLQERAARLTRERQLLTDKAVAAERVRIARELHDVVSHHIALMIIQAGAAKAILEKDPREGALIIESLGDTGRAALDEMRRMLGLLRTSDRAEVPLGPSPGVGEISELISRSEEAGLSITADIAYGLELLPDPYQLTIFRIIQESLTNVIKYAPGARAKVQVTRSERSILIKVQDDGPGASPLTSPMGHGIEGMKERTSLFGGSLKVSPPGENGFCVQAELPLTALESVAQ